MAQVALGQCDLSNGFESRRESRDHCADPTNQRERWSEVSLRNEPECPSRIERRCCPSCLSTRAVIPLSPITTAATRSGRDPELSTEKRAPKLVRQVDVLGR